LPVCLAGFTLHGSLSLNAATLVAPNENTNLPGSAAQFPFAPSGLRYQNVYNASEFVNAMPEGGLITHIAFRIDESDRSSFSAFIPDIEIHMSTSPATAQRLSQTFSENHGPDETIVFPRGRIDFMVTPRNSGANPFHLRFPLAAPFLYDPRLGSLAVDLFVYQEGSRRLYTDASAGEHAVARYGSLELPSSEFGRSALVLELQFTPVPEPAPVVIIIFGLGTLFLIRKKA
jgi:hypothetical protein